MTALQQQESIAGTQPPVMDYEGSRYETDFWVGKGREYEDAVERVALRRMVPAQGRRIAEIGAAFGRLVDLYQGYEQIILFDYSRSQLQTAAQRLGADQRFVFIAGNVYNMPLATGILDTLVMVRVMHHLSDVPKALAELQRTLHRDSTAVLEYANKRNLKAMARWWSGRQAWSPFAQTPIEFVKLNFDFHPTWIDKQLVTGGFALRRQFAVSHFRLPWLKNAVAPATLAKIDSWLFNLAGIYPLSPSVFVEAAAPNAAPRSVGSVGTSTADIAKLLRCTSCSAESILPVQDDRLQCTQCNRQYTKKSGVWDFKDPEPE